MQEGNEEIRKLRQNKIIKNEETNEGGDVGNEKLKKEL